LNFLVYFQSVFFLTQTCYFVVTGLISGGRTKDQHGQLLSGKKSVYF